MREFNKKELTKRVRYFDGQMITAEDLAAEQDYLLKKLRRHNRFLHGSGVAGGLDVELKEDLIIVRPGYAVDCVGDEIYVEEQVELRLPVDLEATYLALRYVERARDRVAVPFDGQEKFENSRIEEGFELIYLNEDEWAEHLEEKGCWTPRGKRHGIPLAHLLYERSSWRLDSTFVRPEIRK